MNSIRVIVDGLIKFIVSAIFMFPVVVSGDPNWRRWAGTASDYEQACKSGYDAIAADRPDYVTVNYRGFHVHGYSPVGIPSVARCFWSEYPNKTPNALSVSYCVTTRDGDLVCTQADHVLDPIQGSCTQTITLSYDQENGHLVSLSTSAGQSIRYSYDENQNLSRVELADGASRIYHYEDTRSRIR